MQAEKVDNSKGLQQRVEEDELLVEVVAAKEEDMSVGCVAAGTEGAAAGIKEGIGGVSKEDSLVRHEKGKVSGTRGSQGSAAGSSEAVKFGLDGGIVTKERKMPVGARVREVQPPHADVKHTQNVSTNMLRRCPDRSRSRSPMEILSRRLTYTLRFWDSRDRLTVLNGRWVKVGELLQLERFHNYSMKEIRKAVASCVYQDTGRPRFEEKRDAAGWLLIRTSQ